MLKQPSVWMGWYPTRFRRKGDVWSRLPSALRTARTALGWAIVGGSASVLIVVILGLAFRNSLIPLPTVLIAPALAVTLPFAVVLLVASDRWKKAARDRGLSLEVAMQAMRIAKCARCSRGSSMQASSSWGA